MVLRLKQIASNHAPTATSTIRAYRQSGKRIVMHVIRDEQRGSQYGQAFKEYGIDVPELSAKDAARLIRKTRIWLELVLAIDSWARWQRTGDDPQWKEMVAVARLADPDTWRNRLRDTLQMSDEDRRSTLVAMAAECEGEPLHPRTVLSLANMLWIAGAPEGAIGPLQAAQRRHPDDFDVNYDLAQHFMNAESLAEATRYITAAIALKPDDSGAYNVLGLAFAGYGAWDEAIASFRQAIKLGPDNFSPHQNIAALLIHKKLLDEAISTLRQAHRLEPGNVETLSDLGVALIDKGSLDEAIAVLREATKLDPSHLFSHGNLGKALLDKGLIDEAILSYQAAIRINPGFRTAVVGLGYCLAQKGQLEQAIAVYKEGLRNEPDFDDAYSSMGIALRQQGKLDEAIDCYQRAIHNNPGAGADHHLSLVSRFWIRVK